MQGPPITGGRKSGGGGGGGGGGRYRGPTSEGAQAMRAAQVGNGARAEQREGRTVRRAVLKSRSQEGARVEEVEEVEVEVMRWGFDHEQERRGIDQERERGDLEGCRSRSRRRHVCVFVQWDEERYKSTTLFPRPLELLK